MKRFRENTTKKSIYSIICVLFIVVLGSAIVFNSVDRPESSHNCRFWGIVFTGELGPKWEDIVKDHLGFLKQLSDTNPNGWGIGYYLYPSEQVARLLPVIRRGGPRALDDPRYDDAVSETIDYIKKGGIAHVRKGTSGPSGTYPNPHPFRRKAINRNFDMLFAHNGTIYNSSILLGLIGDYLDDNPQDYYPYLDSDLYAIYIMKVIDDYPELSIEDCIIIACDTLVNAASFSALNFVMTDGSAIWALRLANENLDYYTLYYYPGMLFISDKWVAASTVMDNNPLRWALVSNYSLVVLRPNQPPVTYPIEFREYCEPSQNEPAISKHSTSLREKEEITSFAFEKLYPNPCKDVLKLKYNSPDTRNVSIKLYDKAGRLVEKVFDGNAKIGLNEISYTSKNISSGIYFVRLETEKKNITEKVLFQR